MSGGPVVPGAGILRWMKLNIAVLVFLSTTVTAIGSALVAGVFRVASVQNDMAGLHQTDTDLRLSLTDMHHDMVSVDQRLNAGASSVVMVQHACDERAAGLDKRIAVLESQIQFFAVRLSSPASGKSR